MGVPGLEPGTSSLSGTRSNQLSYTPGSALRAAQDHPARFHPETPRLPGDTRGCMSGPRAATGGGNRVRTGDPELAKLVLSQLSYAPGLHCFLQSASELKRYDLLVCASVV